jgi:hypothetical protein
MDTGAVLDVRDAASPEKLDSDLGRNLFDRSVNFLSRIGQPVCVDIDAYVAARTGHVLTRSQAPDRLSEIVPQLGHWNSISCRPTPVTQMPLVLDAQSQDSQGTSVAPTFSVVTKGAAYCNINGRFRNRRPQHMTVKLMYL